MINVVFVWVGEKFSSKYIECLYRQVNEHLTVPHRFFILTDKQSVPVDAQIIDVSSFALEGWWNKILLFNKNIMPTGKTIYLDLDTIVLDNVDFLDSFNTLVMLQDFNINGGSTYHSLDINPYHGYGSAIMIIPDIEEYSFIWEHFIKNIQEHTRRFGRHPSAKSISKFGGGDQSFIKMCLDERGMKPQLFQDSVTYIQSFKRLGKPATKPDARIICFHGLPSIEECFNRRQYTWIHDTWHS